MKTDMPKRYRIGIVGCGNISRTHMHAYRTVFATDVVAATDIVEENLEAFSEEYRINALYTDYKEILDKEELDIISVCTLADSHCEITVAVAERGIHVLCEKPPAPQSLSGHPNRLLSLSGCNCRLLDGPTPFS